MQNLNQILEVIDGLKDKREAADCGLKKLWLDFSASVRAHRRQRGMSLEDFAYKLGVGKSMLSYLETGGREWSLKLAKKAAELMK